MLQTDVVYHRLLNNCLTERGSQLSEKIRATEKEGWVLSSTGPDERGAVCVCGGVDAVPGLAAVKEA